MSVLKHSRPIKSTLQNFCSGFLHRKMATTSFCMAEFYDTKGLIIWDTSPQDLIRVVFKQIRIIPIEISYVNKEFALILRCPSLRNETLDKVVLYVCIPWKLCNSKKLLIWKRISNGDLFFYFFKCEPG
jgi:hypothetical protein